MKLVNDLMSRFYKARVEYYDEKANRLNDKARGRYFDGKHSWHKLEKRSEEAMGKAMDAFESYYYWAGEPEDYENFTMESRNGGTFKVVREESAEDVRRKYIEKFGYRQGGES